MLRGQRVGLRHVTEDDLPWLKRVTGDRTIKARFMHQNPFEFAVTFKLWMLANAKPEIHGLDEAVHTSSEY